MRIDFYLVRDMALLARPLGEEAHERKRVRLVAFAVEEKKTHTASSFRLGLYLSTKIKIFNLKFVLNYRFFLS